MSQDLPLVLVLVASFAVAMYMAAAEAALLRISPVRVAARSADDARAARLSRLLDDLPEVLSGVLLVALLAQVAAATAAGVLTQRWLGSAGVTVGSIVLTFVLFVYAEAIPKTFAVRHPARVALATARPIFAVTAALRPVTAALTWLADLQMPGKGIEIAPTVTEEELRLLASRAATEGEITDHDLKIIERGFRFGDQAVGRVMVPRTDMVCVGGDEPARRALDVALASGHRRLPVIGAGPDDVVGVVELRDLVRLAVGRRDVVTVGAVARAPLVVPETKRVFETLADMQETDRHLAIVVDEHGSIAGLVTIEDIAEELVGTMTAGSRPPEIAEFDGGWSVDGGLGVDALADLLGTDVPDGDWTTAAGLVLGLAGRLLDVGDVVELPGYRLRVLRRRGRRLVRIAVIPTSPAARTDRSSAAGPAA